MTDPHIQIAFAPDGGDATPWGQYKVTGSGVIGKVDGLSYAIAAASALMESIGALMHGGRA